eukprot:TRINITY_DN2277_c0_g2_i2.p4 TRINITY_DN2277_c0_g2~~TRINITY_DN2277_c0_g2_i2.p4  ORF type:complete len:131 (-),score=9.12 TRINITY_DN2277_c0_g2_i2:279-671(-)
MHGAAFLVSHVSKALTTLLSQQLSGPPGLVAQSAPPQVPQLAGQQAVFAAFIRPFTPPPQSREFVVPTRPGLASFAVLVEPSSFTQGASPTTVHSLLADNTFPPQQALDPPGLVVHPVPPHVPQLLKILV